MLKKLTNSEFIVRMLTNSEFIVRIQVHNTILGDLNFNDCHSMCYGAGPILANLKCHENSENNNSYSPKM